MSKRLKAGLIGVMLVLSTPALAGECDSLVESGQSQGLKFGKDSKKTTIIGTLAGAFIGGLVGRVASDKEDRDKGTAQGMAIGAVLGGAVGFGIGQVAERRRAAFETESAYLDCEISNAKEMIAQRDAQISAAQDQYAATVAEIDSLNAKIAANIASRRELKALRNKIAKQVSAYETQMADCQKEIDYYELVSRRQDATPGESAAALKTRRQQLSKIRGELQTRYSRIARLRDDTLLAATSMKERA